MTEQLNRTGRFFCLFFFFFFVVLKKNFLGVLLVSTVQQSESTVHIHISPLLLDFLPIEVTAEH